MKYRRSEWEIYVVHHDLSTVVRCDHVTQAAVELGAESYRWDAVESAM